MDQECLSCHESFTTYDEDDLVCPSCMDGYSDEDYGE